MNIKYVVELNEEEQEELRVLTTKGSTGEAAREKFTRAYEETSSDK